VSRRNDGSRDGRALPDEATRNLVKRYFREMQELGETEVYVSPGTRESVLEAAGKGSRGARRKPAETKAPTPRVAASSPAGQGGSGSSSTRSDARRAGNRGAGSTTAAAPAETPPRRRGRGPSAAEQAAELPDPEVVPATLAVGGGTATADMFAESSAVEQCGSLEEVERIALACEKCELARGRTNVVFGAGNPNAALMFVGEAPGRDEDLQGIPFVGRAGQLLDKILAAADIPRDNVYIGNIIKCRPPGNRTPLTNEIEACMPYLAKQLACIKPRIICTLGLPATQTLLGLKGSMKSMRGKLYRAGDIVVIPTYHPAAALRDPRYKPSIWQDFLLVKREYDRAEE